MVMRRSHSAQQTLLLTAEPITPGAFAPYGDVIASTDKSIAINQGKGRRYPDLARVDVTAEQGRAAISRVACMPESQPVHLRLMERHPLGSQAFIPVNGQCYVVAVAPAGNPPRPEDIRVFVADGLQGVNYRRGVWHHPLIALDVPCEFIEVHRAGPGKNCDETAIDADITVVSNPP